MAGTSRIAENELGPYVCNANEVIRFKLVRDERDLEEDSDSFEPEFTHQFFGDSENIFGYVGLKVTFLYSAARLIPYFNMSYSDKVNPARTGGVEADDVYKIVSEKLEFEISQNLDTFTAALTKENTFKPHGELISAFTVENEENEKFSYEIFRADVNIPGFKEYHANMQTFIMWFIDAASYIDVDDDKWDYFIIHEVVKEGDGSLYCFVGYATVYRYYAYPVKIRPRISQMLILPPFQKCGLGAKLLTTINNCYIKDPDVLDITVEDPSESFIRLRDYVDCKNCMTLPSFSRENLKNGFSEEMQNEAREKFKINKKQARRVYEILRLMHTDTANKAEYKAYRLNIKNRLNAPYQRQKLDKVKLQKTLTTEELNAAGDVTPKERRYEELECMYNEVENDYKVIIERLQVQNGA